MGDSTGSAKTSQNELPLVVEFSYVLTLLNPLLFQQQRTWWPRYIANVWLTGRGGLEMLFADQRRHSLNIPATDKDGRPSTIAFLIDYLCENVMKDTRKELFVLDDHL